MHTKLFLNHMKDKIKNIDIHNIDEIKNDIYLLLLHTSDLNEIFTVFAESFIEDMKDITTIKQILYLSTKYQENCNLGYSDVLHIETFLISVINIYQGNQIETINDII